MTLYPQIVVGTYEEFLLGYEIEKQSDGVLKFNLNMASHAHQGSIRCVASHRHLLASSGADEYVNIFTMINRKELAVLTPHAGTVTTLTFAPDGSHLISGSQDGSIAIFRCSDWTLMKIWKDAHKKANGVIGLSVHPSGKMLLSIGADSILRVWNLVKGRQAYAVNYSKTITPGNTLNLVSWSGDGLFYAVALGQTIQVYNVEKASVVYSIKSDSRVSCFDLSQPNLIALGRDDGLVEVHNFKEKKPLLEESCHKQRVKCLQFFQIAKKEEMFLVSADSVGVVQLWRWKKQSQVQKLFKECEINADCRIVCMTILNPNEYVKIESSKETPAVQITDEEPLVESVIKDEQTPHLEKNSKRRKSMIDSNTARKRSSLKSSTSIAAPKKSGASTSKWKVT